MTTRPRLARQENIAITTRFAPSPTGRLHLGHAYSALQAHDFARLRGGNFVLRIEDIDVTRCRPEFVEGIIEDLRWLGIVWDGPIWRQSDRQPHYRKALEALSALGLTYPCFCTRAEITAEIAASGAAPHGGDGPLYPGTCRNLSPDERARRGAGKAAALRLDMARATAEAGALYWEDDGRGTVQARPEMFGDIVLARKDAPAAYHLAVTVDDAAQNISDVVRGEDLRDATHIHRLLQALLGLATPQYHHHPLVTDTSGRRLAKRDKAETLASLRCRGTDPEELITALRSGKLAVGFGAA